jgi:hypothetical protein
MDKCMIRLAVGAVEGRTHAMMVTNYEIVKIVYA